jgi:fructose-specific phosphotransferase system IIC component
LNQLMTKPSTTRRTAVVATALWTLFVWGTRVRNLGKDHTLGGGEKTFAFAVSAAFIAAAVVLLLLALRRRSEELRAVLPVFAIATVGWWAVRSVFILVHHHSWAFRIVHIVLGIISSVLAVVAWRTSRVRS